jgi:glycosyltransferase involved in cell wall biosynthesis
MEGKTITDDAGGAITHERLTTALRRAAARPDHGGPGRSGLPDVTVAMPAYNAGRYIASAITSVLAQIDVTFELIVVDDASTDDTAAVVESLKSPGITLLHNERRRGIGFCHNRVLARSRAPIIVHVDADDVILPGALAKAVAALESAPAAGQAFSNHFELDESCRITREEFERQRDFLLRQRDRSDLRHDLLVHGMVANPLRAYRKKIFEQIGPFNEKLEYAVDYEMTLRIADRFPLEYIPEFLYCQRVHAGNTQQNLRWRALRFWWTRVRICRDLLRDRSTLLGRTSIQVYRLQLLSLLYVVGVDVFLKRVVRAAAPKRRAQVTVSSNRS